MTLRDAFRVVSDTLGASPSVAPGVVAAEAEQIVSAALYRVSGVRLKRMDLMMRLDDEILDESAELCFEWASRRAEGMVLQYLTGLQTFLDHDYEVGPGVLVPRPETEVLVVRALEFLKQRKGDLVGFEIGIGSGAVSVELLAQVKNLKMCSTELSPVAREYALHNASIILGKDSDRLNFISVANPLWVLEPFKGRPPADLIISNPPYLLEEDEIEESVRRHEPGAALFSPSQDPIYFYAQLARYGAPFLKAGGVVLVEVPHNRATQISEQFKSHGWMTELVVDLTERDRVLLARRHA